METVYADSLVLLNAAVDYLLLLSAGKLCALPLRRWRMGLGALWGGGYALLAVIWPGVFGLLTVKLLAGALAVVIAFGLTRRTPGAIAAFFAVSAAFGGAVYAAASLAGRPPRNGLYLPVSAKTLLLSFAVCYALVTPVFRRAGRRAERRLYAVEVAWRDRRAALAALADTGNELRDPVTGNAVLAAEAAALAPLLADPSPLTRPDPLAALEALNRQPEGPRFRLLSCAGVAADRTLLLCFRPDAVTVDGVRRTDLTVAVVPRQMAPDGGYQGVLQVKS